MKGSVPVVPDPCVGVDIGGTNLRVAVYDGLSEAARVGDPNRFRLLAQQREPVGKHPNPGEFVARLAGVVQRTLREVELGVAETPVGIGIAGMLRGSDGLVANAPNLNWIDVPFGQLMAEAIGRPVTVHNDVNAITYGEYQLGAGMGVRDLLAVFVGTGIGAGLVVDGALVVGSDNCAAEIGHTKVKIGADAAVCACGLRGCVEAYAGGRVLQTRARAELAAGQKSIAVELAGAIDAVNPGHLDTAASRGDEYALGLFAEVLPLLAQAVANAITLLNPACLVLGGGVLSGTPWMRERLVQTVREMANPAAVRALTIRDALLGDDAGLVGSALLAVA